MTYSTPSRLDVDLHSSRVNTDCRIESVQGALPGTSSCAQRLAVTALDSTVGSDRPSVRTSAHALAERRPRLAARWQIYFISVQ